MIAQMSVRIILALLVKKFFFLLFFVILFFGLNGAIYLICCYKQKYIFNSEKKERTFKKYVFYETLLHIYANDKKQNFYINIIYLRY